jgi:L-amino acid N-acyltransferase YncA
MTSEIRLFLPSDWLDVSRIYEQGLLTRNATFETEVPPYEQWIKKFHAHLLWVIIVEGKVAGWLGLQPVSNRKVYEGVVEVTIYIDQNNQGSGLGKKLMRHMISESEKVGVWTLYASIFPENTSSVYLHKSHGFREIGYREKIGMLHGKWRNTILFERRSTSVG